jgi:hypothetical protein
VAHACVVEVSAAEGSLVAACSGPAGDGHGEGASNRRVVGRGSQLLSRKEWGKCWGTISRRKGWGRFQQSRSSSSTNKPAAVGIAAATKVEQHEQQQ